jgi:RNA polymerase sigma factor (sigma-70 family)
LSNWDINNVIDRLSKGDDQLFQELYQSYKEEFTCWLQHCFQVDEAIAKDCFQEALSNLYLNVYSGHLANTSATLKTYIFSIGKYQFLKRQDKYQLEDHVKDLSSPCDDEQLLWQLLYDPEHDYSIEDRKVYDNLSNLNPTCRSILEMLYIKQNTYEQISEKLGYQKQVLRTKKWRCLEKLRSLVKK